MVENLRVDSVLDLLSAVQILLRKPVPFFVSELPAGLRLMLALRGKVSLLPFLLKLPEFELEEVVEHAHLDLVYTQHVSRRDEAIPLEVELPEQLKVIKELSLDVFDSLPALFLVALPVSLLLLLPLEPDSFVFLVSFLRVSD